MAWYPGAVRMELQPESDQQAAIRPTQFIMHSIAAPWDERRIYEYWRDSTNLESHFGLDFDGSLGQFIGTQTKADANYRANLRSDGTGAVSIETASNLEHSDPWTPEQVEELIKLGVWLHRQHDIPLRVCRTWTDPGFGYHALFPEWSVSGTACPGAARIRQFKEVVFPGIVARATSTEEDDMTPEERKLLTDTAAAVKRIEAALAQKPWTYKGKGDPRDMHQVVKDIDVTVKALKVVGLSPAQIDTIVDKLGDSLAARLAN
ncbi:N-acetylmuramoyl-L-alanine amidase [Streptomyces filamentosus]|uniref:peptidoglycan recognition protein family protein n=1 Tax=Streptomyces filamentosus TaxID=67294 RepID=UPI001239719C|nr:N-acetylmuramoyl-L-alanine amidase [Streptomyces filamentosus]KAA6211781.1 N-acetylmuramoyl-L-alanine amidase [Streptomyces filamentosus]KAA6220052.1 N-acetylmuramoyl-L-alanine amidase [Streptomyces filamentosus]